MAELLILGAGVMGTALSVPAADAGNRVTLVGSPLDDDFIDAVRTTREHPTLRAPVPESVALCPFNQLTPEMLRAADAVVLAVSSPGIPWALDTLTSCRAQPGLLALVTKGLVSTEESVAPLTYADALPGNLSDPSGALVGIGGPCIARELALRIPTRVCFASRVRAQAVALCGLLQTDYYRVQVVDDLVGVEACAALKNFLCIGISAMLTRHPLDESSAKNPVAGLFNQGVREMALLADWLVRSGPNSHDDQAAAVHHANVGQIPVAYDLAGLGDLHVTVGGGRNSRLGQALGSGATLQHILNGEMAGVTVEGVDTGRHLAPGFFSACRASELDTRDFPLTCAILASILDDAPFTLDFRQLPDW